MKVSSLEKFLLEKQNDVFVVLAVLPIVFAIFLILAFAKSPKELFTDFTTSKKAEKKKTIQIERKVEPVKEETKIIAQSLSDTLAKPTSDNTGSGGVTAGLLSSVGGSGGGVSASVGEVSSGELVQTTGGESRKARARNVVNPDFPQSARARGISGFVVLQFSISEKGLVSNIVVVDSKPKGIFEASAIESIKKWSFDPAIESGKVITSTIKQRINFELDN